MNGTLIQCWWEYKIEQLRKTVVVSQNIKHTPTIGLSHSTHTYLQTRNESICPDRDLYISVHSSLICNSQKMETTQISINRWLDKQILVCPNFSNKKKWTTDICINIMDECQYYRAEWKKPDTKEYTLPDSIYIKF